MTLFVLTCRASQGLVAITGRSGVARKAVIRQSRFVHEYDNFASDVGRHAATKTTVRIGASGPINRNEVDAAERELKAASLRSISCVGVY